MYFPNQRNCKDKTDLLTNEQLIISRSVLDKDDAFSTYQVALGGIGKSGSAIAKEPSINDDITAHIPVISQLIQDGHMQPNEIEVFGTKEGSGIGGFEAVGDAVAYQQKGATGGKVVVLLQEA